jgi:hypothetical protein
MSLRGEQNRWGLLRRCREVCVALEESNPSDGAGSQGLWSSARPRSTEGRARLAGERGVW